MAAEVVLEVEVYCGVEEGDESRHDGLGAGVNLDIDVILYLYCNLESPRKLCYQKISTLLICIVSRVPVRGCR